MKKSFEKTLIVHWSVHGLRESINPEKIGYYLPGTSSACAAETRLSSPSLAISW